MLKTTAIRYIGAYRGVPIRALEGFDSQTLISITDIYKANGSPSIYRPDKWIREDTTQAYLVDRVPSEGAAKIIRKGKIIEIPGILSIIKGGNKHSQGTFADYETSKLYARSISEECYRKLLAITSESKQIELTDVESKVIHLGKIKFNVLQLPNGEYCLEIHQVASSIGLNEGSFSRFIESDAPEALPYKGDGLIKIRKASSDLKEFKGISYKCAVAYWCYEAMRGIAEASELLGACVGETFSRRTDNALSCANEA